MPLTVLTLCDTVFLSFGSVFLLFAFKKKENEQSVRFLGLKPKVVYRIETKLYKGIKY